MAPEYKMGAVMYRCPKTGMEVQASANEVGTVGRAAVNPTEGNVRARAASGQATQVDDGAGDVLCFLLVHYLQHVATSRPSVPFGVSEVSAAISSAKAGRGSPSGMSSGPIRTRCNESVARNGMIVMSRILGLVLALAFTGGGQHYGCCSSLFSLSKSPGG
jgi:hypothetical protein